MIRFRSGGRVSEQRKQGYANHRLLQLRALWRYPVAAGIVLVSAILAQMLFSLFNTLHVSMVFLAGVLISAVFLGVGPALMAAVLGFVVYNYYMDEPRFQLEFASIEDVIVLVVFLFAAILTGGLAGRARDQSARARERADNAQLLYEASRDLSSTWDEGAIRGHLAVRVASATGTACTLAAAEPYGQVTVGAPAPEEVLGMAARLGKPDSGREALSLKSGAWSVRLLRQDDPDLGCIAWLREAAMPIDADREQTANIIVDLGSASILRARLSARQARLEILTKTEQLRHALLSSISHDFRTPLAAILASASSLRDLFDELDADARGDLLKTIQEEAERLNRFVVNLLHMTRLESGALQVQDTVVDMAEVVDQVARRFAVGRNLGRLIIEEPAAPVLVKGDAVLLEHAIANIVDNALRFSPEEQSASLRYVDNGERVRLEVTDCGPGVSPANVDRIFEKFFQESSRRLEAAGTGLGLSIARGLLQAMRGTVFAENRLDGAGLRVTITLPSVRG